jgi:IclR family transcriptional regulator, KDG regulon repressor
MNPSVVCGDYRVQVLDRTFAILSALAESNQLLGPTELGKRLSLNKSTVHRLLNVLEQHRFVERDLESSKYRLGLRLAELGSFAFPRVEFLAAAKPYVKQLASQTGEAAHLGVLNGAEILSVLHEAGDFDLHAASTVGRRSPFHCTSLGKAILAFRVDVDELVRTHRFIPYTRNTIRSSANFLTELNNVRKRGVAIDNEEFQEGLRCIGAPVQDAAGRVIAALSIAGPLSRITSARSRELAQSVIYAASGLSETIRSIPNS